MKRSVTTNGTHCLFLLLIYLKHMVILKKSSQPFQACGPINKQTDGPWPTDCTTSMRQVLHMHRVEIKTTFNNATCAAINAKAERVCC